MADPRDLLQRLRDYWAAQGLGTGALASEAALAGCERRYGVQLPPDLRAYFREVNGMARHRDFDKEWDEDLIRFYQLDEFRPLDEEWPETTVPGAGELFVFANYSIWGWGYAVRLAPGAAGEVHVVYDPETVRVAGSFSEFLESYLARDYSVTYPR
jgi:cell wall assembly regulator SMI1